MFKFNNLKTKKSFGFALVESAVALMVTGSLFMSYQNQQVNKKLVQEVLDYSKPSQVAIMEYYQAHGTFPTNNKQANIPDSNKFKHPAIAELKVGEFGEIIITLNGDNQKNTMYLSKKTIILAPLVENNDIAWNCTDGSLDNEFRPVHCVKEATDEVDSYDSEAEMYEFIEAADYL